MKDLVTLKKVPAHIKANLINSDPDFPPLEFFMSERLDPVMEGYAVAKDTVSFRAISATVNYTEELECVLDGGSSIVVMNKDIWKHLGLPL